jgi:hypothetical protein
MVERVHVPTIHWSAARYGGQTSRTSCRPRGATILGATKGVGLHSGREPVKATQRLHEMGESLGLDNIAHETFRNATKERASKVVLDNATASGGPSEETL